MSKKKRRKFSDEFIKEDAVKLITDQGYSIADAARNLGINAKPARPIEEGNLKPFRRR